MRCGNGCGRLGVRVGLEQHAAALGATANNAAAGAIQEQPRHPTAEWLRGERRYVFRRGDREHDQPRVMRLTRQKSVRIMAAAPSRRDRLPS